MNENLKKYRLGISKAKSKDELYLSIIPFILTFIGTIFFVDTGLQKIVVYLFINFIFLGMYLIISLRIKNISTDNKYLDEDIIRLHEICYNYENLKKSVKESQDKAIRITPFMATLDYAIKDLSTIIYADEISYEEFKHRVENILYNTNKLVYYFYKEAKENLTIALYYYCEQTDEFFDYISYEAKADASVKAKGRIWKAADDAHICYVARHKEAVEFIFNDINKDLPKPKNTKVNDEFMYVSSISIPILHRDGNNIRAVLSMTSNFPNRFDKFHPTNIIDNNFNSIFVNTFYSIAKIIELAFNKVYPNNNKLILKDILNSYNNIEELNENQKSLLEELNT